MYANDGKHEKLNSNAPVLRLHWKVIEEVIKTIGSLRAETGGIAGGNGSGQEVCHFTFDENSRNSAVTYSPDYKRLNHIFKNEWNPGGVRLQVIFHSHPGHMNRLSYGDEVYAERILKAIPDLECLWLPIINTVPDTGMFRLTPWAAYPAESGVSVVKGEIQIVRAPLKSSLTICGVDVLGSIQFGVPLDEIVIGKRETECSISRPSTIIQRVTTDGKLRTPSGKCQNEQPNWENEASRSFDVRNTFDRVQNAYDLALMHKARIIAIGAGGAADWLESMARAGIGQFVMIDPDVVSETNLATQQTYRKDIGRPKVDCIAERIRDINPTTRTVAIQKSLDEITDKEVRRLAFDPIDGCKVEKNVICGLTDSFFAQARVNRIALHLGTPSLCAQVYREGRGAEITFTYPGVTPACHRCILSSRYRHFLEQGQGNDVTSHGTPIFATTRLNAIKGFLTLALIHHGSEHPRWGDMLSRIGKRNLVQLRIDPDFAETLGLKVFDRVFEQADKDKLFFDEVVWLPQDQECPETGYEHCPDCGGTGELRNAVGKFDDTRLQLNAAASTPTVGSSANPNVKRAIDVYKQNRRTT